jgi:hypothetical protein
MSSSPNSTTVVTIKPILYSLSLPQIDALASEFYGKEMSRVEDGDSEKIEYGFDGDSHKENAIAFLDTLKSGFSRQVGG